MLSQLIYVSTRNASCSDDDIQKILEASNRKNGKLDITGVLLYSRNKFLQVLEGEKDLILELYNKIKLDERHKNVIMISLKGIEQRYFPSWQMGSKNMESQSYEFITNMTDNDKSEFNELLDGKTNENAISIINKLFK